MLPSGSSHLDMFDDQDPLLVGIGHPEYGALRVPDGRVLAWTESGSARGVPCVLIPDEGSSRLAPRWLLHDSALPASVRLLCLDRPGTGASDPVGLGSRDDLADDLRHLVETLAVGRIAVIGIGRGADDAFDFALRYPELVTSATGVAVRLESPRRPRRFRLFGGRPEPVGGLINALVTAADGKDLADERTWPSVLVRLPAPAVRMIGTRWHEMDFRQAIAADADQPGRSWLDVDRESTPAWVSRPELVPTPVHLWHGRAESPTGLAELRAFVGDRPNWTVSAVSGESAVMGYWAQVLSTAASSFRTVQAA